MSINAQHTAASSMMIFISPHAERISQTLMLIHVFPPHTKRPKDKEMRPNQSNMKSSRMKSVHPLNQLQHQLTDPVVQQQYTNNSHSLFPQNSSHEAKLSPTTPSAPHLHTKLSYLHINYLRCKKTRGVSPRGCAGFGK